VNFAGDGGVDLNDTKRVDPPTELLTLSGSAMLPGSTDSFPSGSFSLLLTFFKCVLLRDLVSMVLNK